MLVKELIPLATVVTPNIPEAEVLAGMRIATKDNMKKAAVKIHKLGAKYVVVKGGHLEGDAMDLLFDGKTFHEFATKRIDTKHTHGTGCTFASAIATGLARGDGVLEAVKRAKDYVTRPSASACPSAGARVRRTTSRRFSGRANATAASRS